MIDARKSSTDIITVRSYTFVLLQKSAFLAFSSSFLLGIVISKRPSEENVPH
jgi:hypothetical protein